MSMLTDAAKKLDLLNTLSFKMARAQAQYFVAKDEFDAAEKEALALCEDKRLVEFVNRMGVDAAERHLQAHGHNSDVLEYIEIKGQI